MRIPLLAIILTLLTAPAQASDPVGPADPAELEVFLAGLLPSLMATHHVPGAVCLLGATALAGVGYTLQNVSLYGLLVDVPLGFELLLAALLSSVPLTLALPYFALRGIQTERPALLARLHYWLLTGAALLTLAVAFHWNLLGFRY